MRNALFVFAPLLAVCVGTSIGVAQQAPEQRDTVTISVEVKRDAAGERLWIEGQNKEQVDPWRCHGDQLTRSITVGNSKGMNITAPSQGSVLLSFDPIIDRFTRISVKKHVIDDLRNYELEVICRGNRLAFRTGERLAIKRP